MDFNIPEHIQQRARDARTWVEEVLDPLSVDLEKKEIFPPALYAELKRGPFFGVTIPQDYGGEGLSMTHWFPLLEEFSRGYAFVRMMAHCMNGLMWRAIYYFGKEHHKHCRSRGFFVTVGLFTSRKEPPKSRNSSSQGHF